MNVRLTGEGVRVTPHAPAFDHDDTDWRLRASCLGMTWMAHSGRVDEARDVCNGCPVLTDCRTWITEPGADPVPGVVAGMTLEQRGWVDCAGCGEPTQQHRTRNGRCFRCYVPGQGAKPGRPKKAA